MVMSRHLSLAKKTTDQQEIAFKNSQCSRKKEDTSKSGENTLFCIMHLPSDPRKATTKQWRRQPSGSG